MTDAQRFRGAAAFSARSGELRGIGIQKGTPVEDAIAALREVGFDEDCIAALSRVPATSTAKSRETYDDLRRRHEATYSALMFGLARECFPEPDVFISSVKSTLDPDELTQFEGLSKDRHNVRHPATGVFVKKPTPTALSPWRHSGAVLESLRDAMTSEPESTTKATDDVLLARAESCVRKVLREAARLASGGA